jgi:hypothetical protein
MNYLPGLSSNRSSQLLLISASQETRVIDRFEPLEPGFNRTFFFFFLALVFDLRSYTLSHSLCPFCDGYFQGRVSQTFCQG